MLSSPLRLSVDKTHCGAIYRPHPPTSEHKSAVGTIPPNQVALSVKLPDTNTMNVIL